MHVPTPHHPLLRFTAALLLLTFSTSLPGCFFFAADQRARGKEVTAEYLGLNDKSVAIVVYTDQATTNEFPEARLEIAGFIAKEIRANLPTTRLLPPQDVIRWQDETINWFGLSEKDIGKHFGVDRVIMVELLEYATSAKGGFGDLQGRLRATVKVYEVDSAATLPSWRGSYNTIWPKDGPLDISRSNEVVVRKRTLEVFSESLVKSFYTHRQVDKPIRSRE